MTIAENLRSDTRSGSGIIPQQVEDIKDIRGIRKRNFAERTIPHAERAGISDTLFRNEVNGNM